MHTTCPMSCAAIFHNKLNLPQTPICPAACREAYSQTDEQYACNLGCQNQLPFAEKRHEQVQVCKNNNNNKKITQRSVWICTFQYDGEQCIHVLLLFLSVGGHDAQDSHALPSNPGQRALGGRDESGPQLHHLHVDVLPPGRWWQSCHFPGCGKSRWFVLIFRKKKKKHISSGNCVLIWGFN